ncbi:MAG TPA: type II toxin-antitoxin system RelE/ParE family toxin [Candidatus Alectryocaccobium stercorigallinarum]|nr:type II toxin-antitoxin system RelE/ParE family toxin [Candidatus Alectryocaccobium stercorigallinarum]
MGKYKVKLYPRAFRDLDDIFAYIALEKLSPENAKGQTDRIVEKLKKLDTFPQAHQERIEGRYAGKGYRQLVIDNYIAIFRVDEQEKTVYVITIQYCGRNL